MAVVLCSSLGLTGKRKREGIQGWITERCNSHSWLGGRRGKDEVEKRMSGRECE